MKTYELVVLLHPDLEIDVDAPVARIEKLIEQVAGKVIKRDNWGKRRLAYRVKGQDFGVYVFFEIQLNPSKARGLENSILLAEEVLRHLMVTQEDFLPKAKPTKPIKPAKTGDGSDSKPASSLVESTKE